MYTFSKFQISKVSFLSFFGTFVVSTIFYGIWPFLPISLRQDFGVSASNAGLVLTISALSAMIIGFLLSSYSDSIGRLQLLVVASGAIVLGLGLLGLSGSFFGVVCGITLISSARAAINSTTKALLADAMVEQAEKNRSFYLHNYFLNFGAGAGAILGVFPTKSYVLLTSLVLIFLFLPCLFSFRSEMRKTRRLANVNAGDKSFETSIIKIPFALALSGMTITWFVYGHFNSSLNQYLLEIYDLKSKTIVASMIVVNTVSILLLQYPVFKLINNRFKVRHQMLLGFLFIGVSQIVFSYGEASSLIYWSFGAMILALGEIILFPLFNIIVSENSPPQARGRYFGIASLTVIGGALSPAFGGLILDSLGGKWLFLLNSALCVVASLLVFKSTTSIGK